MRGSVTPRAGRRLALAAVAVAMVTAAAALLSLALPGSPAQALLAAPSACTCTAADVGRGIRLSNCQCGSAQCVMTDSAGAVNLQCVR